MKKSIWLVLTASLLLNLVYTGFAIRHFYRAYQETEHPWYPKMDNYNENRNALFNGFSIKPGDIVFVGDSQTEGFMVYDFFPGLPVKNRGISGNETRHVLARIEKIAAAEPSIVLLQIGINDINHDIPIDTITSNYQAIVNIIKHLSPSTTIYCQSIFPVRSLGPEKKLKIEKLNYFISWFCTASGAKFVDTYNTLLQDPDFDKALGEDGLHLTAKGYAIWAAKIDSVMKK